MEFQIYREGCVENMGLGEFSRWIALMECMHYIDSFQKLNVDKKARYDGSAIIKYINEREDSIEQDVVREHSVGLL